MDLPELSENELTEIFNWIDEIPLSRVKKNIARDFSDGVLTAEVVYLDKNLNYLFFEILFFMVKA